VESSTINQTIESVTFLVILLVAHGYWTQWEFVIVRGTICILLLNLCSSNYQ
jgi:hypothetical protein